MSNAIKYVTKASFKDLEISERKRFSKSKCILPISVGQKVHEGEKFYATINLINRSFEACTLLIDDTIQRYTMAIDSEKSLEELYKESQALGDLWIQRNRKYLDLLSIKSEILRWDFWRNSSDYFEKRELVNYAYENNSSYCQAVNSNIEEFLLRYQKKNNFLYHEKYKRAYSLCLEYLKEECSCMCLWAESGYDFEVYPTGRNTAMKATYEIFIKPNYPNLLKSVSLRFKKYGKKSNELNLSIIKDSKIKKHKEIAVET